MMTEEDIKVYEEIVYEAANRAEQTPFAKAHLKIKSSKGKFKSNQQPPKKKRKKHS